MTGEANAPAWLETVWLLTAFSRQRKRAIAKYKDVVRAGVGLRPLWNDLKEIPRRQRRAVSNPLEW
ncbi:MAG: hypothetical protein ACWA44_05315 [Thiotrichales bacterium]